MANAGVWNGQTKIRPGAYINFKAVRKANVSNAERGIVALPLALGWVAKDAVVEVSAVEIRRRYFYK